ncbi:MAG: beta-galactosidase [Anaerolineae bacterium]
MSTQSFQSPTQTTRTLDLTGASLPITSGHLRLGGANRQGHTIAFTNYYMLRDGVPCIPVMGEFHFARYPAALWEDALLKMWAGGVDIIASYVFWNYVEEDEGAFDWSGNRDLRRFVELCAAHDMPIIVRVGPFAHGECRNGGLPDWLYGRPFEVRSNDPRFLAYVSRLYEQIAAQLDGLLFRDGGPVIGIQLDNEYMHCGAPWEVTFRQGMEWVPAGSEGDSYILTLKALARDVGLDVPIYTCTAWRNSPIPEGEVLPMQGGYAFTPWNPDPDFRQSPTREYLFRNRHRDPVTNGVPTYDAEKYPLVCCEIGGGIQITYYHRPVVPPASVEALAVVNLAGGSNLIGYYMYHGGSHAVGAHSFMNEYTVPRISYDFQAPIREFGQFGDSFRCLRLVHRFVADFGDLLAPMTVVLPDDADAITPENTTSLRWAARARDGAGFLFMNNYQDHIETRDIADIRLQLRLAGETVTIPRSQPLTLEPDVTAILPFGLSLDGVALVYATTQLMAKLHDGDATCYCFFAPRGMVSEYAFASGSYRSLDVQGGMVVEADGRAYVTVAPGTDCRITITTTSGERVRILTLTREQAERASKQELWGAGRLVIADGTLVGDGDACSLYTVGNGDASLLVYPPPAGARSTDGYFARYTLGVAPKDARVEVEMLGADRAVLRFPPDILDGVDNILLRIDYVGNVGSAFVDGRLIHDNFGNGTVWEIGLRHYEPLLQKEWLIHVSPMIQDGAGQRFIPTGMSFSPSPDSQPLAVIRSISAVPVYKTPLPPNP